MSQSRELLISNIDNKFTTQALNWKSALQIILCKGSNQINSERAWAKLCSDLRELTPETIWYSVCENHLDQENDENIFKIEKWLKSFILSSAWPFPEHIVIMSLQSSSWRIAFLHLSSELPSYPLPSEFTMTLWKDDHAAGWDIKLQSGEI